MFLVPWLLRSLAWVDDKCLPIRQCRTNSTFCILYNMFVCTRGKRILTKKKLVTHIVCILFSSYLCSSNILILLISLDKYVPNFRETEIKKFSCKVQFDFCFLKFGRKRNGTDFDAVTLQNRLLLREFLQPTIQKCKKYIEI